MKKAVRIVVKSVAGLLLVVVAYVALVLFVNRHDEPLNPEYTKFMEEHARPVVPENENGFDAYQGFVAPKGKDIAEFGKQLRSPDEKVRSEALNSITSLEKNGTDTNCWRQHQKSEPISTDCSQMNDVMLLSLIRANQLFLDRLASLYRYKYFVPNYPKGIMYPALSGFDLIPTQDLLMAKLIYDAKHGKAEEAMKAWIANAEFMQRLYGGRVNMVIHSINSALSQGGIRTYPLIASQLTQHQLAAFQPQLEKVLDTPTLGGWNVEGTLVEETAILDEWERSLKASTCAAYDPLTYIGVMTCKAMRQVYQPNATRNLYLKSINDFIVTSKFTPRKIAELQPNIQKDYNWNLLPAFLKTVIMHPYNAFGFLTLEIQEYIYDPTLIKYAHTHTAQLHMLKLYTDAKAKGVKADEMPGFIAKSPESLQNPFTNKPFEWDAKTHSIVMPLVDPEAKYSGLTIVY